MNRPGPQQAFTRPVTEALDGSQALGRLLERLRESEARYATVAPALQPALRSWVRPGVLDEDGWTLTAPNAAVAAKLRHSVPTLEALLAEAGWPALPLRIRIRPATG